MKKAIKWLSMGILLATANQAFAVTECSGHLKAMYAGDGGVVYFFLDIGAAGSLASGDPDQQNAEGLGLSALLSGMTATIRFTADGVDCTNGSIRNDMQGLWLQKS